MSCYLDHIRDQLNFNLVEVVASLNHHVTILKVRKAVAVVSCTASADSVRVASVCGGEYTCSLRDPIVTSSVWCHDAT